MTRRKLIPEVWYCKYCYQRQRIDIGPDGSLIVCTVCGYGLAPLDAVFAAGSMRTWWEGICDNFYAKFAAYHVKHGPDAGARFLLGDLALQMAPSDDPFTYLGGKLQSLAQKVDVSPEALSRYRRVAATWPTSERNPEECWSVHAILSRHPDRFELIKQPPIGHSRWTCADAHAAVRSLTGDRQCGS